MDKIAWKAYAKLNLTMEVLDRRPDGYHNIRSVMVFVDLHDTLTVEKAPVFSFRCSDPALDGPQNLAVRAWEALRDRYGSGPVSIFLEKRTPCQSGMGGGSADAAGVLRAVNRLFAMGLTPQELRQAGQTLGADVPACITGGGVLAEGIGERITPFTPGNLSFVVLKPEASFSTPRMYARLDQMPGRRPPGEHRAMMAAVSAGDAQRTASLLMNHFEAAAEAPEEILRAKDALLQAGALGASMTGAGSAVFGIFSGAAPAAQAHRDLLAAGWQAFLCTTTPEGPFF
jgi:4-diphosphocytidyl-2-C-methyl-D-erythritol kinase